MRSWDVTMKTVDTMSGAVDLESGINERERACDAGDTYCRSERGLEVSVNASGAVSCPREVAIVCELGCIRRVESAGYECAVASAQDQKKSAGEFKDAHHSSRSKQAARDVSPGMRDDPRPQTPANDRDETEHKGEHAYAQHRPDSLVPV